MEIKVRHLSVATVKELDRQAKEKKLSRQEYLKVYLEKLAVSTLFSESENKYDTLLKKSLGIIEENTKTLNLAIKSLEHFSSENLINIEDLYKKTESDINWNK